MGDPRRINSMTDIIPARGGMGPGGVGNVEARGMSRLDYADKLRAGREMSKQADAEMLAKEKAAGIERAPKTRDTAADEAVAKKTSVVSSGSITPKHGNLDWIEKNMAKGGKVSSASKRADGCAVRGKTRGKMV